MIPADALLVRDSEPHAATVDGEVLMLSIRAGAYFGFNRVGSEIWSMLAEPCRADDICAALLERYDVEPAQAAGEVSAFLEALLDRGLVRIVEEP